MERNQVIVIILDVISLIIFIPTFIIVFKKNLRKNKFSIVLLSETIIVFSYIVFLLWMLFFFLGYTIKIPLIFIGMFLCISGISSIIFSIKQLKKKEDLLFLNSKLFIFILGIILIIVGIFMIFT